MSDDVRQPTEAEIGAVVDAAIVWRDDLIPGTATATLPAVLQLVTAVNRLCCEHPRAVRIHWSDGGRSCGKCGGTLPDEDPTPVPSP